MSFPFMPMYWGDYLADTGHLTVAQHGAYLLLIGHYWIKGGLPQNERAIQRIAKMDHRQWAASRDILMSFFDDNWKHQRIDQELAYAAEKSRVNSANAKRRHSERHANADTTTTTITTTKKERKRKPVAEPPEFVDFWNSVPKRIGRFEATQAYTRALGSGADPRLINAAAKRWTRAEIEKKTEDKFIAAPAVWLNKRRYEDYHAPPERETDMEYDHERREWRWKHGREPQNTERTN